MLLSVSSLHRSADTVRFFLSCTRLGDDAYAGMDSLALFSEHHARSLCFQNIMRQSTELSDEVVRKSIGGVGDFLRIEDDEKTAAQDVVRHAEV